MLNELTVSQKLQAAVIFLALSVAGYLVFANSRPTFDQTINSWTDNRVFPVDPKKPLNKDSNPRDPKKDETVTVFASADGKVDFIEYPNDPEQQLRIVNRPDLRQKNKTFLFYRDPMLAVKEIKDPYRHALSYAVYFKLYRPNEYDRLPAAQRSLLGQMQPAITAEQLAKEAEARKVMETSINVTNALVAGGKFHVEQLDPIRKAVKEFQSNQKDITKDKAKQELARKILTLAAEYDLRVQQERGAAIEKYVVAMEGILTEEQKNSLIALVEKREAPVTALPGRGGRGGRGGNNPNINGRNGRNPRGGNQVSTGVENTAPTSGARGVTGGGATTAPR